MSFVYSVVALTVVAVSTAILVSQPKHLYVTEPHVNQLQSLYSMDLQLLGDLR